MNTRPNPVCHLVKRVVRFVVIGAGASCASAIADDVVDMKPVRLSEHVYYVQGASGMATRENRAFMSNAGFVVTSEGVVVFDTLGTPALARQFLRVIRGVTDKPVKRVVVSHYHADHFYGLQVFKEAGAEIWAHREGQAALASDFTRQRLEQRKRDLAPWVDDSTRLVPADVWLDGDTDFRMGGLTFALIYAGSAHSPEDMMMGIQEEGVLFAGDLAFSARVPFVGTADSRQWLVAIDRMLALKPAVVVPGHGPASRDAAKDIALTRDYLLYLRKTMGEAVQNLEPFEEAYARTDWSRWKALPAFEAANRLNAYNTYILMEKESVERK